MLNEITVQQFLNHDQYIAIDVRSPIEFNEGSIPGAINLPIFSTEERALIGTIYKKEDQEAAKWEAMKIVSPKIPVMMEELKKIIEQGKIPVIHCWRGGMRSKAIATFMEYSGLISTRLIGGYKSYRQYSLLKIKEILPERAIVIHGKTGVGKTEILHRLKNKGYPVLDLELLAGHRGSIFGSIGIGEGTNQKNFDALLFTHLTQLQNHSYFIIEAESKRIGRIVQPDELLQKKANGYHIYLEASIEKRTKNIADVYVKPYSTSPWFKEKVSQSLEKIGKRFRSEDLQKQAVHYCFENDWYSLIKLLLEEYYDPKYEFKRSEYNGDFNSINADNLEDAVKLIEKYIESLEVKI